MYAPLQAHAEKQSLEWMCGGNGAGFLMCGKNGEKIPQCPAADDTGCEEMKVEIPWVEFLPAKEEAGCVPEGIR